MITTQTSKAKQPSRAQRIPDRQTAWTVKAWCRMRSISPNTFYRLPLDERPETILIRDRPRITETADKAWERKMIELARARRAVEDK